MCACFRQSRVRIGAFANVGADEFRKSICCALRQDNRGTKEDHLARATARGKKVSIST
jgi:hypothetical protein